MGAGVEHPTNKEIKKGVIEFITNKTILDEERKRIYNSIPKNQYLCPKCGEVPELKNIYSDNGYIEFFCKNDKEIVLKVDDYLNNFSESKLSYYNVKCCMCDKKQIDYKSQIFKYCILCKKDFCFECVGKNIGNHSHSHIDTCIPINEKNTRCLRCEKGKFISFCQDHKENLCEILESKNHKDHQITQFHNINKPNKNIIIEKNKMLADMIIFNEILLKTYEDFPDNYYHIRNVETLAKSIEQENSRDKNELETLLNKINAENKKRKEAIKMIKEKYGEDLNGTESDLSLSGKGIDNNQIPMIFQIKFNRLRKLDLSFNKIHSINFVKDLNTCNLENLNLGNNEITDLNILKDIDFESLKILDVKNNKVKDFSPLLNLKADVLKLLNIEGNYLDHSLESLNQVIKKYTNKINYNTVTFEEFNKKYETEISKESQTISLRSKRCGNDVFKDLILLSDKYDKINKLDLAECEIDDISLLSSIYFPNIKVLDLSHNKIKNIEVFSEVKMETLEHLYLCENQIFDISPLRNLKANLVSIYLQHNGFNDKTEEIHFVLKTLTEKMKGIEIKIN